MKLKTKLIAKSNALKPARSPQEVDVDIRFLLANERTLLSWVRTGLTLQAGGFALAHLNAHSGASKVSGILAIVFGGIVALIGFSRFRAADRAIRQHRLPRTGNGPAIEVGVVVLIAIVLTITELSAS